MAPSKRPAPSASNAAPAKKRGRPANNNVEESTIAREAAERTSENTRPFQRDTVDELVGEFVRVPGEGWSQAHEDAMNRMWRETNHSAAVVKMIEAARINKGRTTYPYLLTLFKVSLRVFRISPIQFVSFSQQLEYLGDTGSSAIFSKAFCEALTGLIVHPAFNRNKDTLSTVIQYAVICRIDDRRPWPNTSSAPSCPALTKMVEVMKATESDGLEDCIHRIHTSVRRQCAVEQRTPSQLSDLLYEVGETVKVSGTKGPSVTDDMLEYGGQQVRPVSLYDLRHISKTIDETTWDDEAWNCTVAEAAYSYQLVFQQQEAPSGEQLPEYYERSHKQKLREWMVRSGFDPDQQVNDEPGQGFEFGGMEQDHGGPELPSLDHPPGINPPPSLHPTLPAQQLVRVTSNPYASLEFSSPTEGGSLGRIRDLEQEVATLRKEVATPRNEIASIKGNPVSNEETKPASSQPLPDHGFGPDSESYLDWDVTGRPMR